MFLHIAKVVPDGPADMSGTVAHGDTTSRARGARSLSELSCPVRVSRASVFAGMLSPGDRLIAIDGIEIGSSDPGQAPQLPGPHGTPVTVVYLFASQLVCSLFPFLAFVCRFTSH